jgi:hypothetical protein
MEDGAAGERTSTSISRSKVGAKNLLAVDLQEFSCRDPNGVNLTDWSCFDLFTGCPVYEGSQERA